MAQKNIKFEFVDVNEFYDEKDDLKEEKLKELRAKDPSLVLICICFSETLDIRFAFEILGMFPKMRLERGLQLATKGRQIKLDATQVDLLETMAGPGNIVKTTVLHGPEGSGKSLLAMEVLKMKLIYYMKELKIIENEKKVRVWICGTYHGEDRVPHLLRQFNTESEDIKDFCTLKVQPIKDLVMSSPETFQRSMETMLDKDSVTYPMTIVMLDELLPGFTTDKWKDFQGIERVDFVLVLRHAFNDGPLENELGMEAKDLQDVMEQQGVHEHEKTVFCHLRQSFRCSQELLELTYYFLIH